MTLPAAQPRQRIGVFGGAFDPPHNGHALLVQTAVSQLQLDRALVIPTGQAWHKDRALTPALHRLAMARLAFSGMAHVAVDAREIERPGPTFTFDTLTELRGERPDAEFFLLMGQDQWSRFDTWHRAGEVAELAIICVAFRADFPRAQADFGTTVAPPLTIAMPPQDVSSTAIRNAIALHQSLHGLVFDPVARYIEQHHLYKNS